MKHEFTQPQYEAILDFMLWVHKCNNETDSNCKVEALETLKDKSNNFYATYYNVSKSGGQISDIEYIKIDKDGVKTDLNNTFPSKSAIQLLFDRLEKIKF